MKGGLAMKRFISIVLAALMCVAFMPFAGFDTAKAMSAFAPTVDTANQVIKLKVTVPYAGVDPDCIGHSTKVLHEVDNTYIEITDGWKDADGNDQTAAFEKGKQYEYTAKVISQTSTGTAPNITVYDFSVVSATTGKEIVWPGATPTVEKTGGGKIFSRITFTVKFTAVDAPLMDKGAYKLYLTSGKKRVSDIVVNASLGNIMDISCNVNYYSQDHDHEVDLDKDGTFDIGVDPGPDFAYYDYTKLKTSSVKTRLTFKLPEADKLLRDRGEIGYYGTATIVLAKYANPLKVKAKTATVKYKKLKKKSQKLAVTKVIRFTKKGKGDMAYKLVSVKRARSKAKVKKYFKVNTRTGKVKVVKGLKKGTYTVKVRVKAKGNIDYEASKWITVKFKVKVK